MPMQRIRILLIICIFITFSTSVYADINSGLVGWWRFDEASGNAIDSSGGGNTGIATGTTLVNNCKRGSCRSFNGTSDVLNMGSFAFSSAEVTVAVWINVPGGTEGTGFSSNLDGSIRFQAHLPWSNNSIYWDFGDLSGNGRINTDFSSYLNKWTHVALVSNGVNFKAIYINGALATSGGTADSPGAITSFMIGKGVFAAGTYFFRGQMDDFRIYNRVLTVQEIKDLYLPGAVLRGAVLNGVKINQ
jgi:hypothetical protein